MCKSREHLRVKIILTTTATTNDNNQPSCSFSTSFVKRIIYSALRFHTFLSFLKNVKQMKERRRDREERKGERREEKRMDKWTFIHNFNKFIKQKINTSNFFYFFYNILIKFL